MYYPYSWLLALYKIALLISHNSKVSLPVTGFPLASVTATDWTVSVTGLPLAS